jgi:hypothetical protein
MFGQGTTKWSDGRQYTGNYEHDKCSGEGKMIYANGDVYSGEWFNGFPHGMGSMT